jgi:hypothetical protein
MEKAVEKLQALPKGVQIAAAVAAPFVLRAGFRALKGAPQVVQNGRFKGQALPADVYDAVIVGAGPSGSTCAYFHCKARSANCLRRGGRELPTGGACMPVEGAAARAARRRGWPPGASGGAPRTARATSRQRPAASRPGRPSRAQPASPALRGTWRACRRGAHIAPLRRRAAPPPAPVPAARICAFCRRSPPRSLSRRR